MTNTTLKVVIPMAGLGTRLRPHTWSKPKQLVSVAGKTVLEHLLDGLKTYPNQEGMELINIVGYLSNQIKSCLANNYPELKSIFVLQENPRGQSHALSLAREYLHGPVLIVFADTLIETNLSFLIDELSDGIVWVKPVPDPRRFGVVELDGDGYVSRLIEKPTSMENNLVVVGFYYFREAADLISAIDEQMQRDLKLKDEFFLADAVNIMLERGLRMRTQKVDVWLDAGTPEALLETNRYLLEHGHDNSPFVQANQGVAVVPPVYIHPEARVTNAVIGPNVSIGSGCEIQDCIIRNSIFEDNARANGVFVESSLVGRNAQLTGNSKIVNAGDDTRITY